MGFYIDGFNLYHALDDLKDANGDKQHYLKWLNLWALAEKLIDHNTEVVGRVVWCSAEDTINHDKLKRHQAYQAALKSVGVEPILGHFIDAPARCPKCGPFTKPTEKAGDVNVAIQAVSDAISGGVESVYLLTADTDQAGTSKFLREVCPEIPLVIVAPPRQKHSQHLLQYATGSRTVQESTLLACIFPITVTKGGKHVVDRPQRYAPPKNWNKPAAEKRAQRPFTVEHKKKRKVVIPPVKT